MNHCQLLTVTLCLLVGLTAAPHAHAQRNGFEQPPIDYLNAPVNDPVAQLAAKIQSGDTKLLYDDHFGYLKSVLQELDVPLSSQVLVFSKTSLQLHRISPRLPRALYFNDDVYVGFCQRGDVLEFASTDPKQGATFYTLKQTEKEKPEFVRDRGGCLTCHASSRTQSVPGYLVRSVFADGAGRPKLGSGTFTTDHTSKFEDRWGGWYVTGNHGSMRHMGNQICVEDEYKFDRDKGANQVDLSEHFRATSYLTPHSDIVALMVLEHQTQMHNAIAAANYETRQAIHQSFQMNQLLDRESDYISESAQRRIKSASDNVVEYLLMCGEFQLTDTVSGTSTFTDEFQARGKQDSQGRSLRDFDLQTRLFKYPCSYLIHSAAFAALPKQAYDQVMTGLAQVLSGDDQSETFQHLTADMRNDIRQILLATKPDFKKYDRETQ